ncbi:hypothetical protein [Arthrobacter methylotrophus]
MLEGTEKDRRGSSPSPVLPSARSIGFVGRAYWILAGSVFGLKEGLVAS